jgi:signal transduction histidine kinase
VTLKPKDPRKHLWRHREHRPYVRPHPPWAAWDHDHAFPRWHHRRRRVRGVVFLRFAGVFGVMALLVVGGMAALAFLLTRLFGAEGGRAAALVWVGGCGLSLALPLLAAGLALRAFRGIATPVADVMAAADAVAEGDLSARVEVPAHGPDAFGRLAESFNRMAEELERADQRRRNLTADVAHELRTPLHIIQGNLEGILDDVYEPTAEHIATTLDETRSLARLVDDLRTLSLAEAGQLPLAMETVDVIELLADVSTSFSGQAEAAGIDLRVEPAPHPLGRDHRAAGGADRGRRAHHRARHRRGHFRRGPAVHLRPLLARRSGALPRGWGGQRPGAGHRPPAGAGPRWSHQGRE